MSATTETKKPAKVARYNSVMATLEALDEAMARDATVMVFGEDVGDPEGGNIMGATQGLSTKYGELRCRSTPISEQAIVGAAVGAAIAGMRPVAEVMMMNFMTVAMDQIVNHAAKIRFMSGGQTAVPLTIRTMTGVGGGFGGQHSDMLEAWFAHVPGLKVVAPSNPADHKALLTSCIFDDNPCIFIENTLLMHMAGDAPEPGYTVPIGKAAVTHQGKDVTVIGYGRPMLDIKAVAEKLAGEVSVEVIDLRTIVPVDMDTILASTAKTGRVVIVHEAVKSFGVGAELAARIYERQFASLKAPIQRVAGKDTPVPFSKPLENAFMWNREDIEAAIRATLN